MSDAVIIALASVLSVVLSQIVSWFINRQKQPAEINKMRADTDLTRGELAQKYQDMASKAVDETNEIAKSLRQREEEFLIEKKELTKAIETLQGQMKDLGIAFEEQKEENDKWKNYIERLICQLKSWEIVPTPLDLEEAKAKGLSLGEFGNWNTTGIDKGV